ncbi:hypothetical protein [Escherichia phage FXie-2024a]
MKQCTRLQRDPATGRILPAYLKVGDLVYTRDFAFDICPSKAYVVLATSLSKPKVLFGSLEPIQLTGTQFVIKDDSGCNRIFSLEGGLSKWEKVKCG